MRLAKLYTHDFDHRDVLNLSNLPYTYDVRDNDWFNSL